MTTVFSPFRPSMLAVATGLVLASGAGAQAMPKGHHGCATSTLNVTGQGEARVAPDLAVVTLGVTTQADSAAEAMQQNASQQRAVIDALKAAGLAAENIQTSGLNLNPMRDYGENRQPEVIGYEASNMVSIRVSDIDRLGEVLDTIVAAGANQINGIDFRREDAAQTQDDARRAAVEDARHKAQILADAAGVQLGHVIQIGDVDTGHGPSPMRMMAADMAKEGGTPVEPGQLSMSAQVQMKFALIDDSSPCADHRRKTEPAGDMPPPHGTDTGAVAPGEPVVPDGN